MQCSNPACKHELFSVILEHSEAKKIAAGRLPVKLTCAKCGKPVRAYISNEQMLNVTKLMQLHANNLARILLVLNDVLNKKPW